jgi:hypothetical protein
MSTFYNEARIIAQDLGLDLDKVSFSWIDRPDLNGKGNVGYATWDGLGKSEVRIATRRQYYQVLITLAHELRHCWQYQTRTLSFEGGVTYWRGSYYSREPETYKRLVYRRRPQELDANAYANEKVPVLFPDVPIVIRNKTLKLDDLFAEARYE